MLCEVCVCAYDVLEKPTERSGDFSTHPQIEYTVIQAGVKFNCRNFTLIVLSLVSIFEIER